MASDRQQRVEAIADRLNEALDRESGGDLYLALGAIVLTGTIYAAMIVQATGGSKDLLLDRTQAWAKLLTSLAITLPDTEWVSSLLFAAALRLGVDGQSDEDRLRAFAGAIQSALTTKEESSGSDP